MSEKERIRVPVAVPEETYLHMAEVEWFVGMSHEIPRVVNDCIQQYSASIIERRIPYLDSKQMCDLVHRLPDFILTARQESRGSPSTSIPSFLIRISRLPKGH